MKTAPKAILMAGGLLLAVSARAAIDWEQTFTPANGTIQAGNMVGEVFSGDVTAAPAGSMAEDLVVSLNVSGGYNGDFYAYLVSPSGTTDLDITLADDSPNGSIQYVTGSSTLSGSYQPASPLSAFASDSANGSWTLFFADEGSGGGNADLNSWSLGVVTVPEVVSPALCWFFSLLLGLGGLRWLSRRRKLQQPAL